MFVKQAADNVIVNEGYLCYTMAVDTDKHKFQWRNIEWRKQRTAKT